MCISSPKMPPPQAERQAQKLPDNGDTSGLADDIARRRRALQLTATTGALGTTNAAPSVTTVLGG